MHNGESSYRRFIEGDQSAFDELMDAYRDRLIFFIKGYVHSAEEAQDTARERVEAAEDALSAAEESRAALEAEESAARATRARSLLLNDAASTGDATKVTPTRAPKILTVFMRITP